MASSTLLLNPGIKEKRDIIISGPSCWFSFQPMAQFSVLLRRLVMLAWDLHLQLYHKKSRDALASLYPLPGIARILEDPWIHNCLSRYLQTPQNAKNKVLGTTNSWNHGMVLLPQRKGQLLLLNCSQHSKSCVNRVVLDRIQFSH